MIQKLLQTINSIIHKKADMKWDDWRLDFNYDWNLAPQPFDEKIWSPCPKGQSKWNKYMTGIFPQIYASNEGARLYCFNFRGAVETYGVWTRGKMMFSEGRLEIKARFNSGHSTWPAIWMRNAGEDYYEVDICEYFETKDVVNVTFHNPSSMEGKTKPIYKSTPNFSKTDWNTFVCEWDSKAIKVYINEKLVMEVKNKGSKKLFPTESKDRFFYLILSMQYGHGTERLEELPLWMDIQYVRHYVKK